MNAKEQKMSGEQGNVPLEEGEDDFFYNIRPFCNRFLAELSSHFELVVFTAAMQDYADWIINGIDRKGYIKHRLYRQHCGRHDVPTPDGRIEIHTTKDLRLLGRDIKKTILIDNLRENFDSTCPWNGIEVADWIDDMEDTELNDMIPFLKALSENEEKDVRKVLKLYKDNYSQYVEDFCLPNYTPTHSRLGSSPRASIASNMSGTIEFVKARNYKRKQLNMV